MRKDGKNKFYKTLNLDKDTRKLLKWYREIYDYMIKETRKKK